MNEGRPYLQMWRGVWVSFCKIAIVSFLSVRYKSDGLYCRMAGTPSSPTLFFIRVEISISNTSKRHMRCMEHQDAFIRAVYLVGDEDERGKCLIICKCGEGCGYLFAKLSLFAFYPSDIDQTVHIAGWQAHHHHQLSFL